MCGIVGYIGHQKAKDILLYGLKKLEYRGYDSAGMFLSKNKPSSFLLEKAVGKITKLEEKMQSLENTDAYTVGIAHTRWATHGVVNEVNAHPHFSQDKKIFMVHNGIIENYQEIKMILTKRGYTFSSETDSEVLVQLIQHCYKDNLADAVKKALWLVEGAFGIAVMHVDQPDTMVVARNGSPLVLGIGKDEIFIASDTLAINQYTDRIIFLEDGEMAVVKGSTYSVSNIQSGEAVDKAIEEISVDLSNLDKGTFEHFMLKEIYEQPTTIERTYKGKIDFANEKILVSGIYLPPKEIQKIDKVVFLACGSSWHVGLIGKYLIEKIARIPAECDYASEFKYRYPVINPKNFFVAISQSGETADTLASMKLIKKSGGDIFGITNVVGSSIARETKGGIYIHAGHENGVAATKTFTSQLMATTLLALDLAQSKNSISPTRMSEILSDLKKIPAYIEKILAKSDSIKEIAKKYAHIENALFLGRDVNYPIALEGALKLKEISYIHAEGYPAAEMKHGPLALIDENMPCFIIATQDSLYKKTVSNIQEVRARKGKTIVIANEGDKEIEAHADDVIFIPKINSNLQPLLNIIPLQLLSYFIANERGLDIDRPRNLAKSVTVE